MERRIDGGICISVWGKGDEMGWERYTCEDLFK